MALAPVNRSLVLSRSRRFKAVSPISDALGMARCLVLAAGFIVAFIACAQPASAPPAVTASPPNARSAQAPPATDSKVAMPHFYSSCDEVLAGVDSYGDEVVFRTHVEELLAEADGLSIEEADEAQFAGTLLAIRDSWLQCGLDVPQSARRAVGYADDVVAVGAIDAGDCTSGYSPCLSPASDYDCAGGSGDGPAYTKPGITYTVTGSDPYGLDSDNDGAGCE